MDTLVNEVTGGQAVQSSPSVLEESWDYDLGLPEPPPLFPHLTPSTVHCGRSSFQHFWDLVLKGQRRQWTQRSTWENSIKLVPPVCRARSSQRVGVDTRSSALDRPSSPLGIACLETTP